MNLLVLLAVLAASPFGKPVKLADVDLGEGPPTELNGHWLLLGRTKNDEVKNEAGLAAARHHFAIADTSNGRLVDLAFPAGAVALEHRREFGETPLIDSQWRYVETANLFVVPAWVDPAGRHAAAIASVNGRGVETARWYVAWDNVTGKIEKTVQLPPERVDEQVRAVAASNDGGVLHLFTKQKKYLNTLWVSEHGKPAPPEAHQRFPATVEVMRLDVTTGRTKVVASMEARADGYSTPRIEVSRDGKWAAVSDDWDALPRDGRTMVLLIDLTSGAGHELKAPDFALRFRFDPSSKWLYVADEVTGAFGRITLTDGAYEARGTFGEQLKCFGALSSDRILGFGILSGVHFVQPNTKPITLPRLSIDKDEATEAAWVGGDGRWGLFSTEGEKSADRYWWVPVR